MEKFFFVTCNKATEIEVISQIQPKYLLLSYHYFKNVKLEEWCRSLGYKPQILLDSGAYSAYNSGKSISIIDYMEYIRKNEEYIYRYVNLDVIGDSELSYMFYLIMKNKKFKPIPVFHYQENELWLQRYIEDGHTFIMLGGCKPITDEVVIPWINDIVHRYPDISFHVLGKSSRKIIERCPAVYSFDSTTWIMQAIMGEPKHIKGKTYKESTIRKASYNMLTMMDRYSCAC